MASILANRVERLRVPEVLLTAEKHPDAATKLVQLSIKLLILLFAQSLFRNMGQ
jgi:hypothetical protein